MMKRIWRKAWLIATVLSLFVSMLPPTAPASANQASLPEEREKYSVAQFISEAKIAGTGLAEALAAPELEALPTAVGGALTVKGQAALNSEVTVYYRLVGGVEQIGGSMTVTDVVYGNLGRFEVEVDWGSGDGNYDVYAVAKKDGETSASSATQRIELDTTAPVEPPFSEWSNPVYNQVLLQWEPSYIPNDPEGGTPPDPTVDRYEIWRIDEGKADGEKIGETRELFYLDQDLPEMKLHTYEIYAIDRAGNKSESPLRIKAATVHRYGLEMAQTSGAPEGYSGLWYPTISEDGSTAAFIGRTNSSYGLFTYDVGTGLVKRIGEMKDSPNSFDRNRSYAISGNGSVVAYSAFASDTSAPDLYIYNRNRDVSAPVGSTGIQPTWLSLSEDGEWLVFTSAADQLVAGDNNGYSDAFLYHIPSQTLKRISENADGTGADSYTSNTVISGNGRIAAFLFTAEGRNRLYVYDTETGKLEQVKLLISDGETNIEVGAGSFTVSADGQRIATRGDIDGEDIQIYLHDRQTGVTTSLAAFPGSANAGFGAPEISADGTQVVLSYYNRSPENQGTEPYNSAWGAVRIDSATKAVKHIGNRARAIISPFISGDGNRVVYKTGLDGGRSVHIACFDGPCSATAPPENEIYSVRWIQPDLVEGQIPIGSALNIYAFGTAGQQLQAVVGYKRLGENGVQTETVNMQEDAGKPGVYRTAFILPENAVTVVSIKAISASDPNVSASASQLPLQVAGELLVKLDDRYFQELKGSTVVLSREDSLYRSSFKWTENKDYIIPLPGPARYKAVVIDSAGLPLREQAQADISNAERAQTALSPVPHVGFKATIRTAGDADIRDAVLHVYDDNSNQLLGSLKWVTGSYRLKTELYAGQVIRVEFELPPAFERPEPKRISLKPGENEQAFTVSKPPAGVVRGVIKDMHGKPMAGVSVLLVNKSDIESKTVTDEQGAYSLSGPAGDFLLVAEKKGPPSYELYDGPVRIKIEKGTDAWLPLQVTTHGNGNIQMDLVFAPLDELPRKLDIEDWRQAVDYGVTARSMNPLFYAALFKASGNRIPIRGTPGDNVQVCSNNLLENYQLVCTNIVLDDMRNGVAHLELTEKARFTGRVQGVQSFSQLSVALEKKEGSGWKHSGSVRFDSDGRFKIRLSEAGVYRMNLLDSSTGRRLIREVTAEEGKIVEIPPLVFSDYPVLFYGKEGNGLHAKSEVSAGEIVSFRGSYRIPVQLADANLLVEVPYGTSLQEESVVVDGTAASAVKQADGRYLIPLGNPSAGRSGTIQYRLIVGDHNLKQLEAKLTISYRKGSGAPKEELIGSVFLNTVELTLTAPRLSASQEIFVSGRAPAGSQVIVTADGETIGTAEASPVGFWSASVELPVKPDSSIWRSSVEYEIKAQVATADGVLQSERAMVSVDSTHAVVQQFMMKQPDGRTVIADPRKGVSRFPYVIVPNDPLILEAEVSEAGRVSNVMIHVGNEAVPASRLGNSSTFRAMVTPERTSMQTGIYVTYDVAPKTNARMPSTPTVEQWENYAGTMPEGFQNTTYQTLSAAETRKIFGDSTGDGFFHSPAFKVTLPGGKFVYARISMKGVDLGERDSFRFDKEVNEQAGKVTLTSMVATSLLTPQMKAAYAEIADDQGDQLNTDHLMNVISLVGPEGSEVINVLGYLNTAKGYIEDWLDFKTFSDDLLDFTESVYGGECDVPSREYFLNQADNLYDQVSDRLMAKALVAGLGGVAGAMTSGWSAFVTGTVLTVIGDQIKASWQESLGELKKEFEENKAWRDQMAGAGAIERCRDDEEKPDKKPKDKDKVADPVWIWDPSGYVYETVEGNRLEGVTATLEYQDPVSHTWSVWDAEWYGQANPLVTDGNGRYGWDVPEGKWRVRYEKEGYLPGVSRELTVLPPHFDVNVGMVSMQAPQLSDALATTGSGVRLAFSKYMLVSSLKGPGVVTLETLDGGGISGTVEAVDAEMDANGNEVARAFRFIPSAPLQAGQTYRVKVLAQAASYASIPMEAPYTAELTALDSNAAPRDAAARPEVIAGQRELLIQWSERDIAELDHMNVYWKRTSDRDFGTPVAIGKGTGYAVLKNLEPGAAYTIKLATVNDAGLESPGVTTEGTVIAEKALVKDVTPPGEVGSPSAAAIGTDGYNVAWTDPTDPDLRSVIVSWRKLGEAGFSEPVYVERGIGKAELRGLQPQTVYEVKLVTADTYFNLSAGKVIKVGAAVPDGGPGSPGPGTGTGGSMPGKDPAFYSEAEMGPKALIWSGFDDKASLQFAEGEFQDRHKLTVKRLVRQELQLPESVRSYSDAYAFALEGHETLTAPVVLTLRYDRQLLAGVDPRKLGIYRRGDNGQWTYVGGVLNTSSSEVTVKLSQLGTYAVMAADRSFADLKGHWARNDIEVLAAREVVAGVSQDSFQPNATMTRAQISRLLVEMLGDRAGRPEAGASRSEFRDVTPGAWYYESVTRAAELGLVQGSGGVFRPNDPITRQEMAVLVIRALGLEAELRRKAEGEADSSFADEGQIADWAKGYVDLACELGLMVGMGDGNFAPRTAVTRAQGASLTLRMMNRLGIIGQ